jgi:hypothetical protein
MALHSNYFATGDTLTQDKLNGLIRRVMLSTDFGNSGRFSATAYGSGARTHTTNGLHLDTSSTIDSGIVVNWPMTAKTSNFNQRQPTFGCRIAPGGGGATMLFVGQGMLSGAFAVTGITYTVAHVGFKVDGSGDLYATTADGTTETATFLTSLGLGDELDLVYSINGAVTITSVDFAYRKNNGAWSTASITTHLPGATALESPLFALFNNHMASQVTADVNGAWISW